MLENVFFPHVSFLLTSPADCLLCTMHLREDFYSNWKRTHFVICTAHQFKVVCVGAHAYIYMHAYACARFTSVQLDKVINWKLYRLQFLLFDLTACWTNLKELRILSLMLYSTAKSGPRYTLSSRAFTGIDYTIATLCYFRLPSHTTQIILFGLIMLSSLCHAWNWINSTSAPSPPFCLRILSTFEAFRSGLIIHLLMKYFE